MLKRPLGCAASAGAVNGFSLAQPMMCPGKPIQPIVEEPCNGNGHAEEASALLGKEGGGCRSSPRHACQHQPHSPPHCRTRLTPYPRFS